MSNIAWGIAGFGGREDCRVGLRDINGAVGLDRRERVLKVLARAAQAFGPMLTPGGSGGFSGTKKSGISGLVGSTRYLSKSRSPSA